jgi:hypothetical protein
VALIRVTFLSSLSSMSISPLLARLSSTLFTHWLCCCLSHLVFNLFPIGQVKVLSCLTGSIWFFTHGFLITPMMEAVHTSQTSVYL